MLKKVSGVCGNEMSLMSPGHGIGTDITFLQHERGIRVGVEDQNSS